MKKKYTFGNPLIQPVNIKDIEEDATNYRKSLDTTSQPTQQTQSSKPSPQKDEWVNSPEYRNPDGSINPRYKSSRLESAATGARYGISIRTGNPLFDAGAILGGLLGGATHKDLRGKEKYAQDIQEASRLNETTQAHQRLLAQQQQIQLQFDREQRLASQQEFQQKMKEDMEKRKGLTDSTKSLIDFAKVATPDQKYEINQKINKLWDIDADPSDDFGTTYDIKKLGDYAFLFDKNTGELKSTRGDDGQPVSALSTPQQIRALAAWMKLSEDKDAPTMEEALGKADKYITENFKGGLKPNQYNSLKLQLAKQIISNKETNTNSGKVIVNGQVIPTPNLPILGFQTETKQETQPEPDVNVDMKVYQGVPIDIAKWATSIPKESIESLKSVYQDSLKTPKESEQYKDSSSRLDALNRREQQLSGSSTANNTVNNTTSPTELPKGVKPDVKYLQPDGSYIMYDSKTKGFVKFKKK